MFGAFPYKIWCKLKADVQKVHLSCHAKSGHFLRLFAHVMWDLILSGTRLCCTCRMQSWPDVFQLGHPGMKGRLLSIDSLACYSQSPVSEWALMTWDVPAKSCAQDFHTKKEKKKPLNFIHGDDSQKLELHWCLFVFFIEIRQKLMNCSQRIKVNKDVLAI